MQNAAKLFSLLFMVHVLIVFGTCDISSRIKTLELLVNKHKLDHKEINNRLNFIEGSVSELSKEILTGTYLKKEAGHEELEQPGDTKHALTLGKQLSKRALTEDVAFHAYLSSSHHYSNHEIVIFDRLLVNDQSGYTTDDGIFDIPIAGVYAFTWTIVVPAQSPKIVTELVVHGSVKGILTSDADYGARSVSGVHPSTALVVTRADAGANVFIRIRGLVNADGIVLSDDNNVHSTFSAWRLY